MHDRVVTKAGGFKTIENRTKPIPHVIEQRDGCALICMTKKEPTRGHFESLRKQMLMTLEKYSRMYSDRAWEFMRSFCVAKYNWHVWGRIIGVFFFQNGGKRRRGQNERRITRFLLVDSSQNDLVSQMDCIFFLSKCSSQIPGTAS